MSSAIAGASDCRRRRFLYRRLRLVESFPTVCSLTYFVGRKKIFVYEKLRQIWSRFDPKLEKISLLIWQFIISLYNRSPSILGLYGWLWYQLLDNNEFRVSMKPNPIPYSNPRTQKRWHKLWIIKTYLFVKRLIPYAPRRSKLWSKSLGYSLPQPPEDILTSLANGCRELINCGCGDSNPVFIEYRCNPKTLPTIELGLPNLSHTMWRTKPNRLYRVNQIPTELTSLGN